MKYCLLPLLIVSIFSFHICSAQNIWSQIGDDIKGDTAGDNFGSSVSLSSDGTIVAVGAYGADNNGSNSGLVRVLEYNGNDWIQLGDDIKGDTIGDNFGSSVSLSSDGTIVASGGPYNGSNGMHSGLVRVFEYNGFNWSQLGNDIYGEDTLDLSGSSVSLSSDGLIIAIGAPNNNGNGYNSGQVRVFEYNGSDWSQLGNKIYGEDTLDMSGCSVCLSSNGLKVAVGAQNNGGNGFESGHARVYEFDGLDWVQMGNDLDGEAVEDHFGNAVSLNNDGTILAVGGINNDGNGTGSGHVRIFEYNGVDWVQLGNDIEGSVYDYFGYSVCLSASGDTLAVGAPEVIYNEGSKGYAKVYKYDNNTWVQLSTKIMGEAAGDRSARSVSLSSNGGILAIDSKDNDVNGLNSGLVRVFDYCSKINSVIEHACDSYISPSGNYVWTNSGTYIDTILNFAGCDSIITIDLTINSVDTTVIVTGDTLFSTQNADAYQWVDCDSSFAPIFGETNQIFVPAFNGNYAVIVTQFGCMDTSACYQMTYSPENLIFGLGVLIYPNPTTGELTIEGNDIEQIEIMNVNGQTILQQPVASGSFRSIIDISGKSKGIYFIKLTTTKGVAVEKVVLE